MNKRKVIRIFFLLLAAGFLLWLNMPSHQPPNSDKKTGEAITNACLMTDEEAVAATGKFIHQIGLGDLGSPIVKNISLSNVDYPGTRNLKEIIFRNLSGKTKVRFYVGCESGAVENFDDVENWEDNFPYSAKKEPSNCKKTIESLAKQIGIPTDMHFENVEYDWRKGIWVGKYVRIRDGYQYDIDNIAIGLSGRTGKIALYRKIYFGQSCPTEINIQKDEAIKMASTEFHKFIFGRVRNNSDKLYERNERLLIVQPERSKWALAVGEIANPPLKEKPSRLAWIIRYNFTGGIKNQKPLKRIEEMTPQERENFDRQRWEYETLLNEYGDPIYYFEMRIDAGNGEVLHVSHKNPEYYAKRKKRSCK